MKVVLLENVKKLGNKNEIKEVNNGYAKNFLFPQKLAAIATSQMIKQAEANAQKQEELKAKAVLEAEKTAREIKDKRFIIKMKTGDEGQLFEAVSIKKISEKISENGFTIDEKQIEIGEPIKKIGEFKVKINFNKNLTSFINVVVQEEK
jgi:large subunit ribosomal protein L9